MKQVTSRDITPLLRSLGPVLHRSVGLMAWYVVHIPGNATRSLPYTMHVRDATVLLAMPPPGAQQALPDHAALVGIVVELTAPVAFQVRMLIRPPPVVSEGCQGLAPFLRREPFPLSVGIAHSGGQAGVGIRLCEANHALVHHPAVVVVLFLEYGQVSGLLSRLDVLGAVSMDLCLEGDVVFLPDRVREQVGVLGHGVEQVTLFFQEATASVGLGSRMERIGVGGGVAVTPGQDLGRICTKVIADERGGHYATLAVGHDYFVQGAVFEQVVDPLFLGDGRVSADCRGWGALRGILRGFVGVVWEWFRVFAVGGEVVGKGGRGSRGNWEWVW
jgi:hypothetical protein